MFKKHIGHLVLVSLKYFLNIDYFYCNNALLTAFVVMDISKVLAKRVSTIFYYGILTVKEDAAIFKKNLLTLKETWDNSLLREAQTNNLAARYNARSQNT